MSKEKIRKNYVSPLDEFLNQFDQEHPKLSKSQQKEKEKYARIYRLRDQVSTCEIKKIPEDF